jgi:hypothetical protein
MTSKTTNKFSPEVRARAVRMVLTSTSIPRDGGDRLCLHQAHDSETVRHRQSSRKPVLTRRSRHAKPGRLNGFGFAGSGFTNVCPELRRLGSTGTKFLSFVRSYGSGWPWRTFEAGDAYSSLSLWALLRVFTKMTPVNACKAGSGSSPMFCAKFGKGSCKSRVNVPKCCRFHRVPTRARIASMPVLISIAQITHAPEY